MKMRTLCLALAAGPAAWAAMPALMPQPAKLDPGVGALPVDLQFSVAVAANCGDRVAPAADRLRSQIARLTGLALVNNDPGHATLVVECRAAGPARPTLGEDESYELEITNRGAKLTAHTATGALRGFATVAQLVTPGPNGFEIPALRIEDRPRFAWRGLMLDVCRHWMPVEVVERNIEAMAAVKLNVFHWHLSDDQGFRVESKRYPRLQQLGSDGHFYTQDEIRQVVAFAADRGIRVIPEFEMPGHVSALLTGYPELASAPGPYSIERHWGIFQPLLDPTKPQVYEFIDALIGEMARLFPDPYFHIGGDEVDDAQWKASPTIQEFERANRLSGSVALQAWFSLKVQEILRKHGKTMVGWDEIFQPGLDHEAVIQSWRGPDSLAESAKKGYRGLLSYGYYLDYLKHAATYYANDPISGATANLTADEAARILGGEACMWSEYVSPETVDSRVWPSMAAMAERFWSPREVKDASSMETRLDEISRRLARMGLKNREDYLDRLTGGQPAQALRLLASLSESTGIEVRRDARHYTSLIPLNRFVDYVPPESEETRRLSSASPDELKAAFLDWARNDKVLRGMASQNTYLRELLPLSKNLAEAGSIGLQILEYVERGRTPSPEWVREQRAALDQLAKPNAEVVLAAVRPVRALLSRAAGDAGKERASQ
ncbi:MAG TPA: family 20 glycosylhydrolase [Bryobacteraceae bacterium]|nr:family 20 glycosylhydrolase [Bryobacteraceae bacterium]